MRQGFPVTITELLGSGGRPLPAEAAAVVLALCSRAEAATGRAATGRAVTAPISISSVFVDGDGAVSVAGGPVVEDDQTVSLLGHLLLQMLRAGQPSGQRPAARLEALAERAVTEGGRGLTLARFASDVRRFAPADPAAAVRGLFERWRQGDRAPAPADDRVPETIRRLLPEADLGAMAGLPTFHGAGVRVGLLRAGRKLLVAAAVLLLLAGAGASYYFWGVRGERADAATRPSPSGSTVEQRPARELLPAAVPAPRPLPSHADKPTPAAQGTAGTSRPGRSPVDPEPQTR